MNLRRFSDFEYDEMLWGKVWEKANKAAEEKNWSRESIVKELSQNAEISVAAIWRYIKDGTKQLRINTRRKMAEYIGYKNFKEFTDAIDIMELNENAELPKTEKNNSEIKYKFWENSISDDIITTLAKRAIERCSYPQCQKYTSGPDPLAPDKFINIGIAYRIYGANANEPRFNPSQTDDYINSIANAIWLCPLHASIVHINNGNVFPAERLIKMKEEHEKAMSFVFFEINTDLAFVSNEDELKAGELMIRFFDSKHALYLNEEVSISKDIIEEITDILIFIPKLQQVIISDSLLDNTIISIGKACSHFINRLEETTDADTLFYCFEATKKVIGLNLLRIAHACKIDLSKNIRKLA